MLVGSESSDQPQDPSRNSTNDQETFLPYGEIGRWVVIIIGEQIWVLIIITSLVMAANTFEL